MKATATLFDLSGFPGQMLAGCSQSCFRISAAGVDTKLGPQNPVRREGTSARVNLRCRSLEAAVQCIGVVNRVKSFLEVAVYALRVHRKLRELQPASV